MTRTKIDGDFKIRIPESLRPSLKVGDELLIAIDQAGRIIMVPERRILEILQKTAGMWRGRQDIPSDGIDYVSQLRQGRRLRDQGIVNDESH
jgi:bifunctional DNA-binding transcriptional regulator/antitoxin component of YhaV-PrlF toxin-antitoxin module